MHTYLCRRLALAPLIVALGLAGCAVAAKVDAREHYQQSLANYRVCLTAHPDNAKACESQRLIMEADERAYNDLTAGAQQGATRAHNIVIQNR
jgi:hypothetical protein